MPVSYTKISLKALRHNLRLIRSTVPENVELMAILKSDGYGHGSIATLNIALEEGYSSAAVARVDEGIKLRQHGFNCPIYTLGLPLPYDMPVGVANDMIMPIDDTVDLKTMEAVAAVSNKEVKVMLTVDTGMNRLGIHLDKIPEFLKKLKRYPHLKLHGTFTHMATADEKDKTFAIAQLKEFEKALELLPKTKDFRISAANSAGILELPQSLYNLARPGIIMYGIYPSGDMKKNLDLQPVMSLISHCIHVQTLKKGETVGYGATYKADHMMKTATIPIGYADGYPRSLSNKGYVLIGGKKRPIVGRICMDQLMVAVDDTVRTGDQVVLIGEQGNEKITIEEVAELAETIPYELMCIFKRIIRVYET